MAIVNPDHLLNQARQLAAPPAAGPPRQADLRRAISAAYYALFHFILAEAGDLFVGKTKRATSNYALVYRRLDHATLKAICVEARKPMLPGKLARFGPPSGFSKNIEAFATVAIDLQEKRHRADYDPASRFKTSDALLAVMRSFRRANPVRRATFLTLLLFPPR